jgi:hypothetical protein
MKMRGKNEIYMNQETMKQAIQLWLNDQFKNPPTARTVRRNNEPSGAIQPDNFIVLVDGVERQPTKEQES